MRHGKYVRISPEKLRKIELGATKPSMFPTLTALAEHAEVSRSTVLANLRFLADMGRLSERNHLLQKKHGGLSPSVVARKRARMVAMIKFVRDSMRSGEPVSVNLLQGKFGGEKKAASDAIAFVNESSRRVVLRRTKSDQPKRI